jgi:CRISPR-associated exonuclease Cas4
MMNPPNPVEATTGELPLLPLRVHDLKQWAYCPRIVFFHYVMPVDKKAAYKMEHGADAEEAIDRLEKRRRLSEFGLAEGKRRFHVWVNSGPLGLSGQLDLLIEAAAGVFPVDFKFGESQVHENHRVQLAGYALLLEERYGRRVDRGFIFLTPSEEIVPVDLSEDAKSSVESMLRSIRQAIGTEAMPEPTEVQTRCAGCEYRNYCADTF